MRGSTTNILFSGDFAPLVNPLEIQGYHFDEVKGLIDGCDLHVTNLESPLTLSDKRIEKSGPHIKAHPDTIDLLKQAGVNIACLANNHLFDYHEQGILDTLNNCTQNNIDCIGIVSGPDGKSPYIIKEIRGVRVGLLNYCEHEFSVRAKGLLGACGYSPVDAFYDISFLRPLVDWLVVIYHGGNEYYSLPSPALKRDFHYLADLGADMVVGHHTHVISGYEIYNGKPLFYSLGNFFFPYEEEPESWNEGVFLSCKIDESIQFELIPFYQFKDGLKVTLMGDDKKAAMLQKISDLSSIIADDNQLDAAWEIFVKYTGEGLSRQILYPTKVDKLFLRLPFFKKCVSDTKRRRSVINILRCKSLELLLIESLKLRI